MESIEDLFSVFNEPAAQQEPPMKRPRVEEESFEEEPAAYTVVLQDVQGCVHESIIPTDYNPQACALHKPDRVYSFPLDPFQQVAIQCVDRNESVLVAAHTSAGKTVVAEYAIAKALKNNQRVIYTSPIKALSNQKYREFHDEFSDVGLMTGDVTINENASCLVMTTEILRSMLYRGSEIIREIAWVVFDEIHYMRDKERGVVWEETIIMLPCPIKLVFLSATIPNAREFAEWICKMKTQPCHVVYTEMRPVPLQHYIFPAGGDGLYLVVDEQSRFREANFVKAINCLAGTHERAHTKIGTGNNSEVVKIVRSLIEKQFEPAIVFSFSKKECESYALSLAKDDFTTAQEKSNIESIFQNAVNILSEEDKLLPMVDSTMGLLKRGIGIHHGGLLPILKEITEILFQEGLLKILFSTETFSMGLNMPARTVVFTTVRKFDGNEFRWISGGEYIQMSGRAGRRGIDDRGIAILMLDQKIEPEVAKDMLKGHMDALNSNFHLSYNMLLNLMRIEDSHPEHMIKMSFHQFQNDRACPEMIRETKTLAQEIDASTIDCEEDLQQYFNVQTAKRAHCEVVKNCMQRPEYVLRYLQPGRLVKINNRGTDWGWGVIVNFRKKRVDSRRLQDVSERITAKILLDVALYVKLQSKPTPLCSLFEEQGELKVVPMHLDCLEQLSAIRMLVPKDLESRENLRTLLSNLRGVLRQQPQPPTVNVLQDMGVTEESCVRAVHQLEALNAQESSIPVLLRPDFAELQVRYQHKQQLKTLLQSLRSRIKSSKTMILKDDWKAMRRVLRRLGFCSETHVELKGRVACEITTGDELLTTELMLSGVFKDLPIEVMVALLSCLVYEEHKREIVLPKSEELAAAYKLLQATAEKFADVFVQSKLNIDRESYVSSCKPGLMDTVYAWAGGASFAEICLINGEVYEGTIIRCIRRLHELLRQLQDASKAIQSHELALKFKEGLQRIERGIVFAASLYL